MSWYKKAQQGEWWIIDGTAQFADSNIGDMNHSGYVIDSILSNHDLDSDRFDLTKENEKSLRSRGLTDEEINVVLDKTDPRIYGMKVLGWKRVAGRNIQTQTLTESDLKDIDYGLWDAYEQELENDNEMEFNIEVMGNSTYYSDVPYSIISNHNPLALREYGRVYAKNLSWYKFAQLWNVPTSDDIQDKIAELYELEYKHSALRDRTFVGVEERRQNILRELESRLGGVVIEIKEILSDVFSKWLNSHALLSADTWANQRVSVDVDEDDPKTSYQGMVGEYVRYTDPDKGYRGLPPDQKFYDRIFREIIDKASRNLRSFPYLSRLFSEGLNDYRGMLTDELQSDGLKEFSDRYGKKFRSQDQAENWIANIKVGDVDIESIFYFEDINGFVDMTRNLGYEREILAELYKKFVFPNWVQYWKKMGIAETRKNIANIYKKLQGISSSNIGNAMAVISLALNASHQTGEMLSYIGNEDEIKHVLEVMTKGVNVDKWNQELREVGVQI